VNNRTVALLLALIALIAIGGFFLVYFLVTRPYEITIEPAQPREEGEAPYAADESPAMRLDVVPGVTKTRENLVDIERRRRQLQREAGEDGPESY